MEKNLKEAMEITDLFLTCFFLVTFPRDSDKIKLVIKIVFGVSVASGICKGLCLALLICKSCSHLVLRNPVPPYY